MKEILINESVHEQSAVRAGELRKSLSARGVFAVNVMGAPGVGKTSVIERLAHLLNRPCAVVEGDIESDIDTRRLMEAGVKTHQINTGGACHLDVFQIEEAMRALGPESDSALFIENIGNLVCPAEFDIGEHVRILICAVTDGGDKPYKYPLAFERADIIILNKCGLLPHIRFDEAFFLKGVRALNPDAPVFKTDALSGEGLEEVAHWILSAMKKF